MYDPSQAGPTSLRHRVPRPPQTHQAFQPPMSPHVAKLLADFNDSLMTFLANATPENETALLTAVKQINQPLVVVSPNQISREVITRLETEIQNYCAANQIFYSDPTRSAWRGGFAGAACGLPIAGLAAYADPMLPFYVNLIQIVAAAGTGYLAGQYLSERNMIARAPDQGKILKGLLNALTIIHPSLTRTDYK